MTSERTGRTLTLRPQPPRPAGEHDVAAIETLVKQALADPRRLSAIYNRGSVMLEPILLFREHDAPFLIALTVSRDGKPPREIKPGVFRLSGLSDVRIESAFTPAPVDPSVLELKPGRELIARI